MSTTFNVTTPNLGLNKPLVAGDDDLWGDYLNANADIIDNALMRSGGQMLGPLISAPGGSATNVGIGIGDNATGFYRVGATLAITAGGALRMQFLPDEAMITSPLNMAVQRITSVADATAATDALNMRTGDARYTLASGGPFLPLSGASPMTGPLTLAANATQPMHAVPLQQALTAAGGAVTGPITITATGGTTARSMQDQLAETKDVKDYGAVGNGTADDTVAIKAAIAAANGAANVYFPPGTYLITGQAIALPNGSRLTGAGPLQSIIKTNMTNLWTVPTAFCNNLYVSPGPFNAGSTTPALQTDHDITIEELGFDTVLSIETATLRFLLAKRLKFRNLRFFNSAATPTWGGGGIGIMGCDDVVIEDCAYPGGSTNPIDCWQGCTRVKISDCALEAYDNGHVVNGGIINWNAGGTVTPQTQSSNDLQVVNCTLWLRNAIGALLDSFGAGCSSHTITFTGCRFHAKSGTANNIGIVGRGYGSNVKIQGCTFSADPGMTIAIPIDLSGFFSSTATYTAPNMVSTTNGSPNFTVSLPNGTDLGPGNWCQIGASAGGPLVGNGMSLSGMYLVLSVSGPTNPDSTGTLLTCLGPNNATATGTIATSASQVGFLGTFNDCQLSNLTFDGVGYAGNYLINLQGSGHRVNGVNVTRNYYGGSPQYLAIIQFDTTADPSNSANWVRTQVDNILGAPGSGTLPGGWAGDNRITWQPYSQQPDLPVWDLGGNGGVAIGGFVWGQSGPLPRAPANGLIVGGPIQNHMAAAASDAAAATAGVPLNGLYQNAGVVHVRLV